MNKSVALGCVLLSGIVAFAQARPAPSPKISDDVVKIAVLNDMSGLYSDIGGPGSVAAAQLAIDDFGGKVLGKSIQLVSADHQNKADVGASKARGWFDTQQVDMIVDVPNSGVALAVSKVANEKHRLIMVVDRQGRRPERWQLLVLHHRRLRLWPFPAG